jgi:hypothetical protein
MVSPRQILEVATRAKVIAEVYKSLLDDLYGLINQAKTDSGDNAYILHVDVAIDCISEVVSHDQMFEYVIAEAQGDINKGLYFYDVPIIKAETSKLESEPDYDDIPF